LEKGEPGPVLTWIEGRTTSVEGRNAPFRRSLRFEHLARLGSNGGRNEINSIARLSEKREGRARWGAWKTLKREGKRVKKLKTLESKIHFARLRAAREKGKAHDAAS